MRHPHRWTIAATIVLLSLGSAAAGRVRQHPLDGTRLWKRYTTLPDARALAVAGDPRQIWVAGMSGGQPSIADARREALAECGRQRAKRRLQAPCHLYAEGNRLVSTDRR